MLIPSFIEICSGTWYPNFTQEDEKSKESGIAPLVFFALLSMVHGIVKSYNGFISLNSELEEGTVFHVFLPVLKKQTLSENEIINQIPTGRERILLVDDEKILAMMGKTMLERLGYHVTIRKNSLGF